MKLKKLSAKRIKNQVAGIVTNPYNVIILLTLCMLFLLVIVPLLSVIQKTFVLAETELRKAGGSAGDLTLYYWRYLLAGNISGAMFWKPLGHSLLIAVLTCAVAVPIGAVLAWLVVRSDIPCKNLLSTLIIIPYMIPSWCKAMAWLSIFRNSAGGAPGFLEGLGISVPNWLAYGPVAIITVLITHYYAFSYIMISGALRTVNSELEEMAEVQGAAKGHTLLHITFPLVLPAVLSAVIMTFSKSMGAYGVPANLGLRIGYYTLSTRMNDCITSGVKTVGYAMAIFLVILSSCSLFANQMMVGSRKSYETIGGKGGRQTIIQLRALRIPLFLVVVVFLGLALVFPLAVLVLETFQKATGGGYALSNLTLYNWVGRLEDATLSQYMSGILRNSDFFKSLWNTVRLSLIASVITAFLGQFFGYIGSRGRGKWYGVLTEQMVFIPYLIPSVAFSAIFLSMFIVPHGPIPSLYGTFTLIVLVSVVKHFPFASRSGSANMMQIGVQLEEAAEISGASFWRKMLYIVMPLAKNGFFSGFILVFVSIAKELDLIALLMTPQTRTLSYLAFTYSNEALPQMASASSVIMVAFILITYWVASKFFHADISKSMG